ncbi:hypothetical protein PVAG01_00907 [Phlyctema vagabunda]|uniref:Transmembrane protein 42 n=1 Tax=Phlyctema vagabunda TaxID=108571 RepID=A0ABR4PVM2_9HELO
MLRHRSTRASDSTLSQEESSTTVIMDRDDPSQPLLAQAALHDQPLSEQPAAHHSSPAPHDDNAPDMDLSKASRKSQWIILAVASGACAAFNGVFAKLTTTELTTSFATGIANLLGLGSGEKVVEYIVRAIFFALNLIFNGIMWTLFTKALARGTSTTQVSIINTSSNFMITAVLGFFIFSESLPPLWWLGAAMLVAGNVIIGRREEKDSADEQTTAENGEGQFNEEDEELLGESVELDEGIDGPATKRRSEEDDALILDLDADKSEDELL